MKGVSFDLHTHTRWSDGTTTPTVNAALAAEAGLRGVALTDHDIIGGWEEMAAACARHRLEFVPGVELSTEDGGRSVHLLGYWIEPDDDALGQEMARLSGERASRAATMVAKLRAAGIDVAFDRVCAIANGAPLGRSHVAAALVEAEVVPNFQAAFDEWIGEDGIAYVPKRALPPERGVQLIAAAGGVAVLAHPGRSGVSVELLDRLVAAGLTALEADHSSHPVSVADRWRRRAAARGLLATGSSDFHGARKAVRIGERTTPREVVEALRSRRGQEVRSW
ncbi:MAG: PHP domain-containing protein [Egibacteraceae bacterium]